MTSRLIHPFPDELSEQLRDRLRRMLVRVDELRSLGAVPNAPNMWMPPVDVYEMEDAVLVSIEVPGLTMDQLRIKVLDNMLKIEGRKDRTNPTGKLAGRLLPENERPVRFLCLERSYGSFVLSVSIKWPIEAEHVEARLADGVLEIRLPKTKTCGKEIAIPITE
ncbi:MAG: Hsp20/alpha crystallin family protein [Acidobacteriota bacterium]|nr:Hsp20/alpha crystallin family protein [Acidobacteriota bacterium]